MRMRVTVLPRHTQPGAIYPAVEYKMGGWAGEEGEAGRVHMLHLTEGWCSPFSGTGQGLLAAMIVVIRLHTLEPRRPLDAVTILVVWPFRVHSRR